MTNPETQFRQSLHHIDRMTPPVPPIDSDEIRVRAASKRRTSARGALVAAAGAVILFGVTAAVLLVDRSSPVAATPAPATPSPSPTLPTPPRPTTSAISHAPTGSAPTLPVPPAGYRWIDTHPGEDYPSVWVAVPESWGRGESWDADYCFVESRPKIPDGPYVDSNHGTSQRHAITCPDLTAQQQQPHVSVNAPEITVSGDFPWDGNTPGWQQWSTTIDGITVTVTAPKADQGIARTILHHIRLIH